MRTNMRHQKNYYYYIQTLVLLIVIVFIQSYNMNTPLWLDEIYSVHIGRKDFFIDYSKQLIRRTSTIILSYNTYYNKLSKV